MGLYRAQNRASAMPTPLNLLIVEDSPQDADMILAALEREGFETTSRRVDTEAGFVRN